MIKGFKKMVTWGGRGREKGGGSGEGGGQGLGSPGGGASGGGVTPRRGGVAPSGGEAEALPPWLLHVQEKLDVSDLMEP